MKSMRNEDILSIYEKDIPVFLVESLLSPAMKRIEHVGMHCGMEYTSFPIYKDLAPYSRGFHSLGVALITYRFTKDRKQAPGRGDAPGACLSCAGPGGRQRFLAAGRAGAAQKRGLRTLPGRISPCGMIRGCACSALSL